MSEQQPEPTTGAPTPAADTPTGPSDTTTANDTNSQSNQSDTPPPVGETVPRSADEINGEKIEQSQRAAEGEDVEEDEDGDGYHVTSDYNPYNDPVIPSSAVARNVRTELDNLGHSPTLKGLHEAQGTYADDEDAEEPESDEEEAGEGENEE